MSIGTRQVTIIVVKGFSVAVCKCHSRYSRSVARFTSCQSRKDRADFIKLHLDYGLIKLSGL